MKKVCMTAACCLALFACADKQQPPAQEPSVYTTTTSEEARTVTPAKAHAAPMEQTTAPVTPATPVAAQPAKADPTLAEQDTANPSNTGVNKRDRDESAVTPMKQSNTKSDIDITAAIRRSVVGDSAISFSGKNVKIVTKDGHVTLRGPVKTDQEKSSIESKAKAADGVKDVDNQLEIKK